MCNQIWIYKRIRYSRKPSWDKTFMNFVDLGSSWIFLWERGHGLWFFHTHACTYRVLYFTIVRSSIVGMSNSISGLWWMRKSLISLWNLVHVQSISSISNSLEAFPLYGHKCIYNVHVYVHWSNGSRFRVLQHGGVAILIEFSSHFENSAKCFGKLYYWEWKLQYYCLVLHVYYMRYTLEAGATRGKRKELLERLGWAFAETLTRKQVLALDFKSVFHVDNGFALQGWNVRYDDVKYPCMAIYRRYYVCTCGVLSQLMAIYNHSSSNSSSFFAVALAFKCIVVRTKRIIK